MRKKDRHIILWIDPICIDQENTREKEEHIQLMSNFYKHALNTVILLGASSLGSDSAVKLLEDVK